MMGSESDAPYHLEVSQMWSDLMADPQPEPSPSPEQEAEQADARAAVAGELVKAGKRRRTRSISFDNSAAVADYTITYKAHDCECSPRPPSPCPRGIPPPLLPSALCGVRGTGGWAGAATKWSGAVGCHLS